MKINIDRYGQGEKIIFIHGSGGSMWIWHSLTDYLKSSMEVILVDLPGHGQSSGEGYESVDEYADSVYSAIKEHNLLNCIVAGHSLGGAIAMSLALSHPEIIKGIILIGTGAKLRVLPQILNGIINDKANTVNEIVNIAFSKNAPSSLKKEDYNETMKCKTEVIYKDFKACDNFNIIDSLHLLNLPCLIMCGADDLLTPMKYSEFLSKQIKDSIAIFINDAGHMVMLEKPEEMSKAISDFVKSRE